MKIPQEARKTAGGVVGPRESKYDEHIIRAVKEGDATAAEGGPRLDHGAVFEFANATLAATFAAGVSSRVQKLRDYARKGYQLDFFPFDVGTGTRYRARPFPASAPTKVFVSVDPSLVEGAPEAGTATVTETL